MATTGQSQLLYLPNGEDFKYSMSAASFFGVMAVSVDRFLAFHLHLRYQKLVTHKRVVIAVIGIWVYSAFVSSMILWGFLTTLDHILSVDAAFGFIITFMVYIRIYLTFRRHKNQIQSLEVQDVAQSDEIKNFAVLIISAVGIFYVYLAFLVCYLPFFICSAFISNLWLEFRFKDFISFLNFSRMPRFVFEPCHIPLEDERNSTSCRGRTAAERVS